MTAANTKGYPVVLSMWQPFASLRVEGIKKLESRGRHTDFRGEFLVHATQSIPKDKVYNDYYLADEMFREHVHAMIGLPRDLPPLGYPDFKSRFITGAIIGKAILTDSRPSWDMMEDWETAGLHRGWEREFALGDHGSNRFAWGVQQPEKFTTPIQIKGCQSLFWRLPENVVILP